MISILSQGSSNNLQPLINQEHWNFEKTKTKQTKDINVTSWALPFLPETKSHTNDGHQDQFLLAKRIWKSSEEKKRGKKKKTKTKQDTIEKPLTESAVNGMHFSIQVTHPCRTSKTGLESLPYSQCQATSESLGLSWIATHSTTAGRINTKTSWSNRRGVSFLLDFHFLESYFKTLKSAV